MLGGPEHMPVGPQGEEKLIRSLDGVSPRIHPTAFVSEAAYVIGDVTIGESSSVWPGTVIRGDTGRISIGRFTCIQDNSVVHGDDDVEIGDGVVIGHRVVCHAKTVGDRVLIGNGATVNDGVVIGEESLLASGAVVVDDVQIPPRSLVVGVPGKVRGHIRERHLKLIERTYLGYVEKTRRYKAQSGLEAQGAEEEAAE